MVLARLHQFPSVQSWVKDVSEAAPPLVKKYQGKNTTFRSDEADPDIRKVNSTTDPKFIELLAKAKKRNASGVSLLEEWTTALDSTACDRGSKVTDDDAEWHAYYGMKDAHIMSTGNGESESWFKERYLPMVFESSKNYLEGNRH